MGIDSTHEAVKDVKLKDGGELHRFLNGADVEYSAIYQGDFEAFSCERRKEKDMIDYWNRMQWA